jgi:uncharacterized circularly permuted ATP-grasp superfamily protein
LQAGLRQRVKALNMFLWDVYHDQEILKAGIIPAEQVLNNAQYRPIMQGVDVPGSIYAHITGVDIVRAGEGEFYVLEDNLRVPSGVSYMLEDRKMMMRLFPSCSPSTRWRRCSTTRTCCWKSCGRCRPRGVRSDGGGADAGAYNSAYFEHTFLAQQMGVELVEGRICSSRTRWSTCARRRGRSGSM